MTARTLTPIDLSDATLYTEDRWRERGQRALADFKQIPMRETLAELLEISFAPSSS